MDENNQNPEENQKPNQHFIIDDFEIFEEIGSGAFSRVHIAKHIPTGCYCAAKVINVNLKNRELFTEIMREVSVFMQIDHPNICNLYRLSVINPDDASESDKIKFHISGENEITLVFFMEYATRGTLLELVNSRGGINEYEAQKLFVQIFEGLRHLHIYHFLVHRDLKLENILIDSQGKMKITDFGLASTYYNNQMRTFVGTAGYQPPEIIAGSEYSEKCDVWSLGVCLYAMITGSLPFSTQNRDFRVLIQEATQKKYHPKLSPNLVDLLKKMFEVSPSKRPTLLQLQNHPWLKGVQILSPNISPQPVIFYHVSNPSMIAKFKRRPFKFDSNTIEKFKQNILNQKQSSEATDQNSDIDERVESLKNKLSCGITDSDTATYFCLNRFLGEKPQKPVKSRPNPTIKFNQETNPEQSNQGLAQNQKHPPPPQKTGKGNLKNASSMPKDLSFPNIKRNENPAIRGSSHAFSKKPLTNVKSSPHFTNIDQNPTLDNKQNIHLHPQHISSTPQSKCQRPVSNKSSPIMASVNWLFKKPFSKTTPKKKPI